MDNSIQIPLDLPDVRVLEVSKTEEDLGSFRLRVPLKAQNVVSAIGSATALRAIAC